METEIDQLHVFFHFVPFLSQLIEGAKVLGAQIDILTIRFPASEVGPPSLHMADTPEMQQRLAVSSGLNLISFQRRPDVLVANMFFPWPTDVAAAYRIPCLFLHGMSCFALCASTCLNMYKPHNKVSSDLEHFVIPNLPDEIEFTRSRVPEFEKRDDGSELEKFFKATKEVELKSYGVLVNSFYELEPAYADHYSKVLGRKAWHVGPLFLYDKGFDSSEHECFWWLDSRKPNLVIYVSFGTVVNFNDEQLTEIAAGREASKKQFIWVVKKEKKEGVKEEWLREGFEDRMEGKGLIIRG
ncbi:LOW QUALITY PROTEIN: UDP-glucuronosyl/UDP-glucosyltransferase [Trema orientale]|uniref:UDP-glucuronosyl/UDP-glucosyltransferase n=1 Tax=Trema orientale TaxID=63057 RepID=A0A2P5ERD0_TREOI|nr:LOW QUALITY PROTEIN: UDP-glucuronosyl/UDP-glucosyltransferase [Trema orientale]